MVEPKIPFQSQDYRKQGNYPQYPQSPFADTVAKPTSTIENKTNNVEQCTSVASIRKMWKSRANESSKNVVTDEKKVWSYDIKKYGVYL